MVSRENKLMSPEHTKTMVVPVIKQPPYTPEMCGHQYSSNFVPRIGIETRLQWETLSGWRTVRTCWSHGWKVWCWLWWRRRRCVEGSSGKWQLIKEDKVVSVWGKQIAYWKEATYSLSVGTRCVAIYREDPVSEEDETDGEEVQEGFYPAVIGEKCRESNGFRYLVFYDDGYTLYLDKSEVRPVSGSPWCLARRTQP